MLDKIIKTSESEKKLFPFQEKWESEGDICSQITMSIRLWGLNNLVEAK